MRDILRKSVKRFAKAFGLDVVRRDQIPTCTLGLLDLAFPALLAHRGEVTVLQVGANDGVTDDPVHRLIVRHHLRSLLLEPVPDAFLELAKTYQDEDQVDLERVALSRTDGTLSLYVPRKRRGGGETLIASSSRDHLRRHGIREEDIRKIEVPCVTLRTLLDRHDIEPVGVVVTDTEGFDFDVVEMILDEDLRPGLIHFESSHLRPAERYELRKRFRSESYRLLETKWNTLAVDAAVLRYVDR